MSFATGAVVANLYYIQPLVDTLAREFHADAGRVGVLVTLLQLGYAVGLATLVPLGDLVERRWLLVTLLVGCSGGLAVMALAPTLAVIASVAVLVGLTSVAVQVIVPFAAQLAGEERRGRVVGTVMSGLLLGILLSRTVSGVLAGLVGWRWVFGIAAIVTLAVAVLLWLELPSAAPTARMSYPALLGSVLRLVRDERVLRYRMVYGACAFAAFSVFWSTAGFLLARPPYHWSETQIGLFALLGAAGAVAARFAGSLADRGHARWATLGFVAAVTISFGALLLGGHSVLALAVGVLLLDLGVQGLQITNQCVIYELRPDARARITTAYMTGYFLGGTAGSALGVAAYVLAGWTAVCVLGAVAGLVAAGVWLVERVVQARSASIAVAAAPS
ncbi:MFS transporter [Pseudonocardia eucalypti]|uniref:MFS transporter n=1 Tax=Pseudonocardia eucalypti TaxID=648755 RepID=A0ABP9PYH3_9PSEU|nr:putative MFS family arabinose efflux permease [Pseudonocardia eucalypti]